ncbi:MAG: LacI family DNA-binding transcriptional regulator [Lachnospiraceae bacterium]
MNKTDIPYAKISEKTGVSVTTISRALTQPRLVKHSTLKEIYRAIEELGGILPDNASSISSNIRILAIIPCLDNPFYTSIVQGIQAGANQNNCQLLIMGETITQYNLPLRYYTIHYSPRYFNGVLLLMQKVAETQILDDLARKMRTGSIIPSVPNLTRVCRLLSYHLPLINIRSHKKLMRSLLSPR